MHRYTRRLIESKTDDAKASNPYYNDKIQKALNKLISEEWIAGNLYRQMVLACDPEDRLVIKDVFLTISSDEINDHMTSLIEWAISHGYDVPAKTSEFMKYASAADVKQFEKFKTKQKADYYISEAVKSEESAIKSYEEALNIPGIVEYTDLQSILWHIFYDEEKHSQDLVSALIAYQAHVNMSIC